MAHGLINGSTMAYAGETPWHGLGQQLTAAQQKDWAHVKKAAGLLWSPVTGPLFVPDERYDVAQFARDALSNKGLSDKTVATVINALQSADVLHAMMSVPTGQKAIRRSDTGAYLGVVGEQYQIIDHDVLGQMSQELAGIAGAKFVTAGSLWGGKIVWTLIEMPETIIAKQAHREYILGTTTHDGSAMMRFWPTDVKVVCNNTFRLSESVAGAGKGQTATDLVVRVSHSGDVDRKVEEATKVLQATLGLMSAFKGKAEALAEVDGAPLVEPLKDFLFPFPVAPVIVSPDGSQSFEIESVKPRESVMVNRRVEQRAKFDSIWADERAAQGGSALALFDAATGFADHAWRYSNTKNDPRERRFRNVLLGEAAEFKTKAMDWLTEAAGVAQPA